MRRYSFCFALIALLLIFATRSRGQSQSRGTATVEGSVVNAFNGDPIAGARVKVSQSFAEPVYTKTDDQGHFRFTGLSPGYYVLNAERPGFLRTHEPRGASDPIPMLDLVNRDAQAAPGAVPVVKSVGPDGVLHAELIVPLTPYAVITGRVTEPTGLPRADCTVQILARPASSEGGADTLATVLTVHTDDRGEYRAARLTPGTYYVAASKSGPWTGTKRVLRTTYYPGAVDAASAAPLELAGGQQARADIKMLNRAGVSVAGKIVSPATAEGVGGSDTSTMIVLNQPEVTGRPAGGFCQAINGQFELKNVMPGRYTLLALARSGNSGSAASSGPPQGKPVLAALRQVDVGDQNVDGIEVDLEPLRDLPGTVTFARGCTPGPVKVFAEGGSLLGASRAEAAADADGQFVLSGLTPARHRLTVVAQPEGNVRRFPVSAQLGDRDALHDGFYYPVPNGETLRITVDCTGKKEGQ